MLQKQPAEVFYKIRCSEKLHKHHRKTSASVSFLIKLQASACNSEKRPWHRRFSANFVKLLGAPFLEDTPGRLLLMLTCCFLRKLIRLIKFSMACLSNNPVQAIIIIIIIIIIIMIIIILLIIIIIIIIITIIMIRKLIKTNNDDNSGIDIFLDSDSFCNCIPC